MLILLALGALIGASALNFISVLPKVEWIIVCCLLSLFSITFCLRFVNQRALRQALIVLLAAILSFGWSASQATKRLAWTLPIKDVHQLIEIQGNVVGISKQSFLGTRLTMKVDQYKGEKLTSIIKMRLFWPKVSRLIQSGDRMHCQVQLKFPWHLANPGGSDREKALFIEGIRATGKIIQCSYHKKSTQFSLDRLRQILQIKMDQLLNERPFLGVIQAMTLGINNAITPDQWHVFRTTGTAHIVSISGAHVGFVAIGCLSLMRRLVKRSVHLTTYRPAIFYGATIGILAALLYSALAGFSIPTQRSCVMILVSMWAIMKRQSILTWHALALAWLGIYLLDPFAPLQMGFWLSFGCVAVLIGSKSLSMGSIWQKWLMPQWVIFVGLIPISTIFFQQVALFSPLSNIIALPIVSFVIIPFSLLGLLFLSISSQISEFFLEIAHKGIAMLWPILEAIARMPFSIWEQGRPPLFYSVLALMSVFILLTPKKCLAKYLGWFGFLPLIFYQGASVKEGECRFTLLDVGQGLAAVIQTHNHTLLYDAGPQYGLSEDAGEIVLKPFLRFYRIKQFDKVIISHGDLDHRAGLKGLKNFPIREIVTSEPKRLAAVSRLCKAGESWEWEGVRFTFISPIVTSTKNRNDLSCVLKITTKAHSLLLTGDIENAAEKRLVQSVGQDLKSDIMVVPHHGSLTSSSQEFLNKVAPKYALYPVGLDNQYGFPKAGVLDRYESIGALNLQVYRTGALTFVLKTTGNIDPPSHWRERSHRCWHTAI